MNEELTRPRKLEAWELELVTGGKGRGGDWEEDWEEDWDDDWDDWD